MTIGFNPDQMDSKGRLIHAAAFRRVSTGLTVSRKTATNFSRQVETFNR